MRDFNNMIILYSTGCPNCIVLKEKLKAANIQYVEVTDIDTIVSAGFDKVPMLDVDGVIMVYTAALKWVGGLDEVK
jgi:glutaredoxin-related protein